MTATSVPESIAQRADTQLPEDPVTVLVADDEHLVASGVAANLKDLGFEVVGPATDGDEAIDLARRAQPDLALIDIRMPKTDGIAAAEILFRDFGVPVVLFSAYSDGEYVTAGGRAGVFGYLLKPVTQDHLRVGISVAWRRYRDHVAQASEITTLKARLEDRKVIEQAKWIIVRRKGVDEPDAMRLLQRQARNNRRKLVEVARSIIDNEDLFSE